MLLGRDRLVIGRQLGDRSLIFAANLRHFEFGNPTPGKALFEQFDILPPALDGGLRNAQLLVEVEQRDVTADDRRNQRQHNAAARVEGLTYGRLMHGLKTAGIEIDRKVLADIAVRDQAGFSSLAKQAQAALEG